MTTHKNFVSYIVLTLILLLTTASIINIIAKAHSYHSGFSANLIGIAFGVALAVTVYVVMIADTATTRWTAATFAVLFAVASSTIQTALYIDEGAAFGVALAFGCGVPFSEAALAVVEALLRKEVTAEHESAEIANLQGQLTAMTTNHTAAATELDAIRQQLAATTSQLAAAKGQIGDLQKAASQHRQPAARNTATSNRQQPTTDGTGDAAKLTPKQIQKIQDVVGAAKEGFAVDTDLIEKIDWVNSETSARRYRSLAEEHGFIHRNGDGMYHPTN